MTIIEKFEHFATRCTFAFVLLTPDDQLDTTLSSEERSWRARQNVIMEMGWFMARLGRRRVSLIYKGKDLEIPSDIAGILYLRINDGIEGTEVPSKIEQRLRAEGLLESA